MAEAKHSPKDEYIINNKKFKVENTENLDTIFYSILSYYGNDEDRKYTPLISYRYIYKGAYYGMSKYKLCVTIGFKKNDDKNATVNYSADKTPSDDSELLGSTKNHLSILDNIKSMGGFVRKYEFGHLKSNLSVINAKLNENKTWFFNLVKTSTASARQNNGQLNDSDNTNNQMESSTFDDYMYADSNGNGFKDINDLYNALSDTQKKAIINRCRSIPLNGRPVNEVPNKATGESESDSKTNKSKQNQNVSDSLENEIGFMNWRQAGFLQTLTLDIIGDPIWLYYYNDFNDKNITQYNMPYIIFEYQPFVKFNDDDIIIDNYETFISPYQVTNVESTFQNGKFTQTLKAVVPPSFFGLDTKRVKDKETDKENKFIQNLSSQAYNFKYDRKNYKDLTGAEIGNMLYGENGFMALDMAIDSIYDSMDNSDKEQIGKFRSLLKKMDRAMENKDDRLDEQLEYDILDIEAENVWNLTREAQNAYNIYKKYNGGNLNINNYRQ